MFCEKKGSKSRREHPLFFLSKSMFAAKTSQKSISLVCEPHILTQVDIMVLFICFEEFSKI
jgi:hypothetical protein